MDRVDNDRNPGQTSENTPIDPRLGIVGMEDVDPLLTEDSPELDDGSDVAGRGNPTGRGSEWYVTDAVGFDFSHVVAGRRNPDCFSEFIRGNELRKHEIAQTHVHRREVRDLHWNSILRRLGLRG